MHGYDTLCVKYGTQLNSLPALVENERHLREKITIMCLMDMISTLPAEERRIALTDIAARTKLSVDGVEFLLMKALALHLIEGVIDQVEGYVQVSWVQPRILTKPQIQGLKDRLDVWITKVSAIAENLEQEAVGVRNLPSAHLINKRIPDHPIRRVACASDCSSSSMTDSSTVSSKALPKPGKLLSYDFRSEAAKQAASKKGDAPIKCLQWNIERGYKLDAVIEELKKLDADVLALQEIDIGCDRSAGEDTGVRIAQALGLNYVFLCEFEELRSPLRDASSQGGGVHGNGIMTKSDMTDFQVVEHTRHPIDWENPTHPLCQKEPRHGRRFTLASTIQTPQGPMAMYTAHLECFCGMLDRIHQFSDILRHSRTYAGGGTTPQAIFGDLNTLAHSIARLSPYYCCDQMRW
eukprot:gene3282-13309_t